MRTRTLWGGCPHVNPVSSQFQTHTPSPTLYEIDLTKIPLSEVETGISLAIAGILIELSAEQGSSRITVNREEVDRRLQAKGYDPDTGERSH